MDTLRAEMEKIKLEVKLGGGAAVFQRCSGETQMGRGRIGAQGPGTLFWDLSQCQHPAPREADRTEDNFRC